MDEVSDDVVHYIYKQKKVEKCTTDILGIHLIHYETCGSNNCWFKSKIFRSTRAVEIFSFMKKVTVAKARFLE